RSSTLGHKGGSAIPLPGSALPARRCPPDKVRPVACSSRAASPALSMIPRGSPAAAATPIASPYQTNAQQKNSMLDKLKLFKSNDAKPAPSTNGKRTSSSSGVSSARSERSDSSASLEPTAEVKPATRNTSRLQQARPKKPTPARNSPNSAKKEAKPTKVEVEKHAQKVASLSELKVRATVKSTAIDVKSNIQPGTGIPKPTAAIKGTTKVSRGTSQDQDKNVSRESSQNNISHNKPVVALVSPMKSENNQLSESSHSASTGHHSNSSESSVIYKPSSESGSEHHNIIPNRKEPPQYISDVEQTTTSVESVKEKPDTPEKQEHEKISPAEEENKIITGSRKVLNNIREEESLSIEPMRPLLRGYCGTLTLPNRQRHYPRVQPDGGSDYCEISLCNGYLSEGEILRHTGGMDLGDGYMSESGSVLYARRLQTLPAHIPNGTPRLSSGLTVLTEQTSRRGGSRDSPPPPPPPAPRSGQPSSKSGRNGGIPLQDTKHGQWKRYTDSPGVGSPPQPQQPSPPAPAPSSPTSSRRERRSSPHGKEKSGKGVRGVPQSFGYVKRSANGVNGNSNGNISVQAIPNQSGKTASVSAVPRTKVKVSGGTQTCSSDLQQQQAQQALKASPQQFKSYSLTGNAASQLSQSVRERLMMGSQSLPKGAGQHDYGLILRHQPRPKVSDGSLSDTQAIENSSPYAPWLRHSNTYSVAPRLSETDSLESLTSLPGHRSSLTHTRLLRDSPSRLSRSNSIRSTKSEKLYPSMLHRNNTEPETEPYYCLPIGSLSHWSQPTSPAPGNGRSFPLSPTLSSAPRHQPKNDEVHGSSISLVSTASSLYSSAEEKQAHEIRKLRRELTEAQEKVYTLTSQLSTNAHVVSAFEQSLTSMTQRLQHLTATSEKKESELQELRTAMDSLRAQSIQAGIGTGLARQPSSDSVSSLSSACSLDKQDKKNKKKGWLRSSFTKAFSRNAKVAKAHSQQEPEADRQPPPPPPPTDAGLEVVELQKQLREKDLVLTDIRLEALSSAHQLESLKDTVMKMRSEMLSLKQNNERLQRMVSGAATNLPTDISQETRSSSSIDALCDLIPVEEPAPEAEQDGKRIAISVYLGQPQSFEKYYVEHYSYDGMSDNATTEISIAHTNIGASTSWAQLDNAVRRAFKQYVARLDPGGGLGLGSDAIASYKLGEAERKPDSGPPDLLPVGYAIGRISTLHLVLQPVAALAFEALIPKGVAQRLVSLLAEHRRLVLCGAPGTGKTHLANRLAEFHAQSLGRDPAEAVATFNVDNKSAKELRQYLAHLSEQAAAGDNSVLPCVVVLDNLHKAGPLADALGSLPRNLPCLLGTMAQSACSATSLQLQHGFRWVLVAPHMEPARGLLGRVLRRRLATLELEQGPRPELAAILGWLPRVWQHLNAFLETHSSGDVAIGPRLFLSCPLELDASRAWFADVWNYSLSPYLREAAREGLQLYGRRAPWTDPTQFILDTYPWPGASPQGLTTISSTDVGLEAGPAAQAENEGDPLLNMLMRLQEAANYSSPHSNDSDCNSLDSNLTHNVGTESVS
ncbi:unnamed protein product, partial [Brassicogethes aeneus]